MNATIWLEHY